jgi:epoxyqueuosine reductase
VLTTLDLDPDSPETDRCGTCTLCIKACPTDALREPYVLDSSRCISYLTIEHRDALPDELVPQFENWIFGCDICQDVCPWNEKFSLGTNDERFAPGPGNAAPDLNEWSRMTETEFHARFAGSPVRRAKWAGLLRNIRALQHARGETDEL